MTLVAIVGGSGAGKSWLAKKLVEHLNGSAVSISLDDFYLDRSRLTPARRAKINFDHPRAIDWKSLERVLIDCQCGRPVELPSYDFTNHCRKPEMSKLQPASIVLVEGLWLLRRRSIRRLFDVRIFISCPRKLRYHRRLKRDLRARARSLASINRQFRSMVDPMHRQFVEPQKRWADLILPAEITSKTLRQIAARIIETTEDREALRLSPQ